MVARGKGTPKDYARAAQLYLKACDGHLAAGCGAYADFLVRGVGVPVDRERGMRLLEKSCAKGYQFACDRFDKYRRQSP